MDVSTTGNGSRAASEDVMIDVQNLTRYYGDFAAVNNVSFKAYRGEIVGFLGPNGAGKTTAMRIITGYLPPSSGRVAVAGHDVVDESLAARRHIGYLPESTPLYTDMTVHEYLAYVARLRDVDEVDAAVDKAMAMTDVTHRADDLIGKLSKGYRQRVGIAQALVHDPEVIILDEPTIGLDPRQILEVRALIEDLKGEHTMVLSTHILPEAQQVCDRVLIINGGRIVAEDTPEGLQQRLTGGERIRVAVPGDLDEATVQAALGAVEGVQTVDPAGDGLYQVIAAAGTNPRPDLAETVVGRGWPLLELKAVGMTLEEIFLELTATAAEEMPLDAGDWVEEEDLTAADGSPDTDGSGGAANDRADDPAADDEEAGTDDE